MKKIPFAKIYDDMSPDEKKALAKKAKTSVPYLSQIVNGHREAGVSVMGRLINADPRISLHDLRPSDFPEPPTPEQAA